MREVRISGTGHYAPEKVVPNSYFNELLGEDVDTWLVENLTIRERRWCSENQSTADLAEAAAKRALENAGITAADLDLIIVATDTPEFISPSTASVIQDRMGAVKAGTFDLNTACAGFVTACDTAVKFIKADEQYNKVLVVGAYAMSKYLDLYDKKTITLFADGAGAVVLESSDKKGFLGSMLHTEGQYNSWMGIYGGGTNMPLTEERVRSKDHLLKFVKKFPKELNPEKWTSMINSVCAKAGVEVKDVKHFFFTQININSIWQTLDNLNIPRNRAVTIMHKYGYTGSACIPMALDDAHQQGILNDGDKIIFMGSGGGLAFACQLFEWNR
ncbi:MAG: 3-oxoacyl-[acyl-carrier-protein] synthase 3 [Ignavibacteriaceae bacterium]|nr:3-oxoacyl-[acyl-carrier-protein] synthase 3 [Ignavibacteriaceae bacterium]